MHVRDITHPITSRHSGHRRLAFAITLLAALLGSSGCATVKINATTEGWTESQRTINEGLTRLTVYEPDWKTLAVSSSRDVALPPAALWNVWTQLDKWPVWSDTLHVSTRWVGKPGWREGSEFEQVLDLGFPIGETSQVDQVGLIIPGKKVSWWRDEGTINSCHIWEFQPLAGGGTRIIDTEVFHGWPLFFAKPTFLGSRWLKRFDHTVEGLVHYTEGRTQAGGGGASYTGPAAQSPYADIEH